jgi:hypothetical protein
MDNDNNNHTMDSNTTPTPTTTTGNSNSNSNRINNNNNNGNLNGEDDDVVNGSDDDNEWVYPVHNKYQGYIVQFMTFNDGVLYTKDSKFSKAQLLALKPSHICR